MFRSALVALKPAASQSAVIDYSVACAERLRMRLDGISVVDTEEMAVGESAPGNRASVCAVRDQERLQRARHQAAEVVEALQAAMRAKSLDGEARVSEGDAVKEILRAAMTADFVVCGHTPKPDAHQEALLASILKVVPRPAILVPTAKVTGQRVLVAYDSSLQSAQALSSFVHSGLATDRPIVILSVHENLGVAKERAKTASEFLKRHNLTAEVLTEKLEREPGRHILDAAQRQSAELRVMGAFGKKRGSGILFRLRNPRSPAPTTDPGFSGSLRPRSSKERIMSVGRICVRDVDLAEAGESVQTAAQRMNSRKVGTLLVINSAQEPIGVVTDRDLTIRVLAEGRDPVQTPVGQVLTPFPRTVREDTSIEDALHIMRSGQFRRLPVLDKSDKLVGLLSLDDILDLLTEEFREIGGLLRKESPRSLASEPGKIPVL
jgi:CBS domain-containing protein/nucleotide-binding universal stress UspA family protein